MKFKFDWFKQKYDSRTIGITWHTWNLLDREFFYTLRIYSYWFVFDFKIIRKKV